MQKLLIAESSDEMITGLVQLLSGSFMVKSCQDGETALELLQSFRPDVLILDLLLPFKDGLTVLQDSPYRPPVIVASSLYANPYMTSRAMAMGVSTLLVMPTPRTLAIRLMDILSTPTQPDVVAAPEKVTAKYLYILNFASHRDGYNQLCAAIPLFAQDPDQNLSKELYPAVAQLCGNKSGGCVERSIRSSVEDAWNHRNPTVWQQYFPGASQAPSNKAFIARMAQLLDL